ncbi:MAG: serine/threonine protein kinase [Catenulispora sp.]|nr:serine/threonine protein kinase [Catenulispora sp.]
MSEVVAGRYVLIDRIGAGGAGEVWRAFDRRTRGYCAAKVIRHPEAATLVRAVFEQGVRLDHPHVVTPYAWAADDEQVLLAMPLVRGGSLAVLLRDHGSLPPRYGAEILRQLLVALHHVHTAGLVHRDVKPANVLLEPTGTGAPHARLADFGLVLTPDRPRVTGTFMVVGTRAYMAPESLKRGDQGVAQDLYAAGLVGTEMIGSTAGPLSSLLTTLTASDPAYRPRSAGQALQHLDDLLTGWPLQTPAMIPDADEPVEVFEQIGPLPSGWGPTGPASPAAETETVTLAGVGAGDSGAVGGSDGGVDSASATTVRVVTRSEPIGRPDITSAEFRVPSIPPGLAADGLQPSTATTAAGPLDHVRSLPVPTAAASPTPANSQRRWLLAAALAAALAAVSAIGAIVLVLR